MKFIVSLHAYDCLDNVNYSAQVNQYWDYEDSGHERALTHVGSIKGEGIDDPREWLRDVLVAILETL